jgi:hypothetical protein
LRNLYADPSGPIFGAARKLFSTFCITRGAPSMKDAGESTLGQYRHRPVSETPVRMNGGFEMMNGCVGIAIRGRRKSQCPLRRAQTDHADRWHYR